MFIQIDDTLINLDSIMEIEMGDCEIKFNPTNGDPWLTFQFKRKVIFNMLIDEIRNKLNISVGFETE